MKKINLILGVLAMVVLMFVNVSFGTFEQVYPDVKVETIEANDQMGEVEKERGWEVVDCGASVPYCYGWGLYKCCQ